MGDMLFCTSCHSVFDQDEATLPIQVYHPEVHAWESYANMFCPYCGKDTNWIVEAQQCQKCGEWFGWDEMSTKELCNGCFDQMIAEAEYIRDFAKEYREAFGEFAVELLKRKEADYAGQTVH